MRDGFEFRRAETEIGEDVYSKIVRAGKRTYFFDVKATRNDDYFIIITESRKKTNADGTEGYEKNKIYLYKEDFDKFAAGFQDTTDFIRRTKPDYFIREREERMAREAQEALEDNEFSHSKDY